MSIFSRSRHLEGQRSLSYPSSFLRWQTQRGCTVHPSAVEVSQPGEVEAPGEAAAVASTQASPWIFPYPFRHPPYPRLRRGRTGPSRREDAGDAEDMGIGSCLEAVGGGAVPVPTLAAAAAAAALRLRLLLLRLRLQWRGWSQHRWWGQQHFFLRWLRSSRAGVLVTRCAVVTRSRFHFRSSTIVRSSCCRLHANTTTHDFNSCVDPPRHLLRRCLCACTTSRSDPAGRPPPPPLVGRNGG